MLNRLQHTYLQILGKKERKGKSVVLKRYLNVLCKLVANQLQASDPDRTNHKVLQETLNKGRSKSIYKTEMATRIALRYVGSRTSVFSSQRLLCSHERGRGSSVSVRVLYDGECPICVKEISFLQLLQRKRAEKVDFVDISLPEYDGTKYGVSYEMAMDEMTVIDMNNKIHRGVPAFTVMYNAVGLGWLGWFISLPLIRPLMDRAYGVFARNRLKWTGREGCTTERCVKKKT